MEVLRPPSGSGPGVVIAHAWWGLNQSIRDYGARLTSQGFVVALPDMFDEQVATTVEGAQDLADTDWSPDARTRLTRAITELAKDETVTGDGVALIGFSYGGFFAYGLAGKAELPLRRVVIYYATRKLASQHVPVLAHFAESDPFESMEDINEVAAGLAEDGPPNAAYAYPATTHWFAEADRPEYDPNAAELAFARTVEFLKS